MHFIFYFRRISFCNFWDGMDEKATKAVHLMVKSNRQNMKIKWAELAKGWRNLTVRNIP